MRSNRKYTRELLAPLVAQSTSLADVIRALRLQYTGGNHRLISARIREYEIDTSHFDRNANRRRVRAVCEETLRGLVGECESVAAVLRRLDLPHEGRTHREMTLRMRALNLDVSHMSGARWNKGKTAQTHRSIERSARKQSRPDDEVFVERSPVINDGPGLIKRLRALGWEYCCSVCGISEWRGVPLVLHLDHINGIASDNRFVNLRLLCPNCHSQTDTYCNKTRPTRASEAPAYYSCYTSVASRAWRNR